MSSGIQVAVVGATTTVGTELLKILEERDFPVREIVPLEAKGSIETHVQFRDQEIPVRSLAAGCFKGVGLVFFAGGERTSREYVRLAAGMVPVVIDLSSFSRMSPDVPLLVPEINAHRINGHKGIIASPSPSVVQLALALYPIHKAAGVKRAVVSILQAVSSSGRPAMNELTEQITDLFNFRETESSVFPHQIAFNVIPQAGPFRGDAFTEDEARIEGELRKVIGDEGIKVCATSVNVPVFFSHSQSVNIETEKKITPDQVRTLLKRFPGVKVEDDPSEGVYPLAVYAAGKDDCFVGRIRQDPSCDNGIALWIVSDNTRKGSALNAVQIAEHGISAGR